MVIINPPLGIYKHLAAFSFMLAGVFADLLVVRLCLSSAYIFLIVNGIMGSPLWPQLRRPGHLTVDMLIWGIICFYVHMASVVNLLRDERHVTLDKHEEALWRMFYRVGGLSRMLFYNNIAQHMTVVQYKAGDAIDVETDFHINLQGTVQIDIYDKSGTLLKTAIDGSGCMFDLKKLGLLDTLTSPMAHHVIKVTAKSDCTCFQFSNQDIQEIANSRSTKAVWQTVFIGILARIAVQRLGDQDPSHHAARINPTFLDPLFEPLTESEKPNPLVAGSGAALERPLAHIAYCMKRFFTPPWPFGKHLVGIRHNMLSAPVPTEGATETLEKGIEDSTPLLSKHKDHGYKVRADKNGGSSTASTSYDSMA
mmetsp:Transcript_2881/g.6212  ORF Transcript_2881/g.6212 Transcript_2881/m.6212 type:complete len:366 (+) Transcript_2881:178-1275(+)